jgi:hypothetical protein
MKEVYYDNTKSNVNLVSTQNSYADKINKIKYSMDVNKVYASNLKPKNKMNIISEKPPTKKLSSSLNFKPLGFIFIAIIILSALSFFLLFFLKKAEKEYYIEAIINKVTTNDPIKLINQNQNKISRDKFELLNKTSLRYLDEKEYDYKITNGTLFYEGKGIIKIKLYFNSPLSNLDHMFEGCKDIIYIDLSHIQPPSIESMSQTFKGCEKLQRINFDSIDTSKVKSMDSLFENCISLTDIIGIERFNTSSVDNISRMFYNCTDLIVANLSAFNIDTISNLKDTFNNTNLKYIDLRNSYNATLIESILPPPNDNLTVITNETIFKHEVCKKYNCVSTIKNLECEIGNGYKCNSCKFNSLECKDCNNGYFLYYYLSNMRCWRSESYEEKKEEVEEEEEEEENKENEMINYDEEKNNSYIEHDEDEKEEGKQKEKEKAANLEEEEDEKKVINEKEEEDENKKENEKEEEEETIKENEKEEEDETLEEIEEEEEEKEDDNEKI